MARQSFTLGAPTLPTPTDDQIWSWLFDPGLSIDPAFLEAAESGLLREVSLGIIPGFFGETPQIRFLTARPFEHLGVAGPDMSPAWESSSVAITLEVADQTLIIPGPTSPSARLPDGAEPYEWDIPRDYVSLFRDFFDAIPDSNPVITLTIDDGLNARIAADFEATAGGSASLIVAGAPPVRVSADFEATAAGAVRATLTERPLTLADLDLTGFNLIASAIVSIDAPEPAPTADAPGGGDLAGGNAGPLRVFEGSLLLAPDLEITEIERRSNDVPGERLQFRHAGAGSFLSLFGFASTYPAAELIIRTSASGPQLAYYLAGTGAAFNNWRLLDTSQAAITNALAAGDWLALAFVERIFGVELAADFEAAGGGSVSLTITEPAPVRVAADFEAAGVGSTTLIAVGAVVPVRVSAGFAATGGGAVSLIIGEVAPVRVAADLEAVAGGGVTLLVFQPSLLRIAADFEAISTGAPTALIAPDLTEATSIFGHWLLSFPDWADAGLRYWWSGEGDLEFEGITWRGLSYGDRCLVDVGPVENAPGAPTRRVSAAIAVGDSDQAIRNILLQDPGPLAVRIEWIVSRDAGHSWRKIPRAFVGRLSEPIFEDGLYRVEVETWGGDIDRGHVRRWSHEEQIVRYPNDTGLRQMRAIADGIEIRWPP